VVPVNISFTPTMFHQWREAGVRYSTIRRLDSVLNPKDTGDLPRMTTRQARKYKRAAEIIQRHIVHKGNGISSFN
jgi:hypothetical protein